MMLAGLIHIPPAMPVLAAFATRLVWQLARSEAHERVDRATPLLVVPAGR
jgi:hypothetical protein